MDSSLFDADVNMGAGVAVGQVGFENLAQAFNGKLREFDMEFSEIKGKLESIDVSSVKILLDEAAKLKEKAMAEWGNKPRNALAMLYAANIHIKNAAQVLARQEGFIMERAKKSKNSGRNSKKKCMNLV